MKLVNRLRKALGVKNLHQRTGLMEHGVLIFRHTSEVIRAESLLREAGLEVSVKGPPPEVRTGCDLAIEFPLVSELKVLQVLDEAHIRPLQVLPLHDLLLEPVGLYHTKDFGHFLMVRAANMKITVDTRDLSIVNVSGGGCPDVPYLAEKLIGKRLFDAPDPRTLGQTLCGYALHLAFAEIKRRCPGS